MESVDPQIQKKSQYALQILQQNPLVSPKQLLFPYILNTKIKVLFLIILSLLSFGIQLQYPNNIEDKLTLELIRLTDPSALCLDGSLATYYIHEGNPQKILILFVGGGWCRGLNHSQALQSCYQRSFTQYGSSVYNNETRDRTQGIFMKNSDNYFSDWTIVELSYCDGSGHQGTRHQPIKYKGRNLYFRGHNITLAQIDSLQKKYDIFSSKTKEIALGGTSAGTISAFHWLKYFQMKISPSTKLHFIADSGIFLNRKSYQKKNYELQQSYKTLLNITNKQIGTPLQDCNMAYPNELWKCMFFEYFHPFIKTPAFYLQSQYDGWSMSSILKLSCQYGENTIDSCSNQQKTAIQKYSQDLRDTLKKLGEQPGNGIWAPSCIFHSIIRWNVYINNDWNVPQHSGNSAGRSLKKWMKNKTQNNVYIDEDRWPNNSPCSIERPKRLL